MSGTPASKKVRPTKAAARPPGRHVSNTSDVGPTAFEKEVEIYPAAVQLLWQFYQPADRGKAEGTPRTFAGEVTQEIEDCVHELTVEGRIEVTDSFASSGVTAKLTKLGLLVMADQPEPGHLKPARVMNPATKRVTVYDEVKLGF
jgi:hypothetical protein